MRCIVCTDAAANPNPNTSSGTIAKAHTDADHKTISCSYSVDGGAVVRNNPSHVVLAANDDRRRQRFTSRRNGVHDDQ